jgi:AraC-like DNA-binding protein
MIRPECGTKRVQSSHILADLVLSGEARARLGDLEPFQAAGIAHRAILLSCGHVNLRISMIARSLAIVQRTLERSFQVRYHQSMLQYQSRVRLRAAKKLLCTTPQMKMEAVALTLGYKEVRDLVRFFRRSTSMSPSEWRYHCSEVKIGRQTGRLIARQGSAAANCQLDVPCLPI